MPIKSEPSTPSQLTSPTSSQGAPNDMYYPRPRMDHPYSHGFPLYHGYHGPRMPYHGGASSSPYYHGPMLPIAPPGFIPQPFYNHHHTRLPITDELLHDHMEMMKGSLTMIEKYMQQKKVSLIIILCHYNPCTSL